MHEFEGEEYTERDTYTYSHTNCISACAKHNSKFVKYIYVKPGTLKTITGKYKGNTSLFWYRKWFGYDQNAHEAKAKTSKITSN